MDLDFIWKALVISFGGVLILRIAGRKSISQLTVAQTTMMIAVGSLIIQPVSDKNIWITMIITLILVLALIFIEFIVMKSQNIEKFFYGSAKIVVENGNINVETLKKLRLTVDMLELRIRQQGIQNISDIEWATIESNGQLGYMLKPEKQFATKQDIQFIISLIQENIDNNSIRNSSIELGEDFNLFTEVKKKSNEVE
ncbi:DUF421 domain-containing protein [Cellulosilyticum sp. I15G10I2]|uniref:DUF421 domain-containing protein n=1 Tax=Cellulosilyticum sp. I15G10I2 TaxID=1892843 RepID=UPI00085CA293|nr:DUF421 domain-containing protein [Cellulosilyticum sp. I15G10I2]